MGVGKTTVAAALARRLGVEHIDLDTHIERDSNRSIAQLFEEEGEARFRQRERDTARRLMTREGIVVSLGGGTVTNHEVRRALLNAGTLITLSAPLEVLVKRVGSGKGRPLLSTDPGSRLAALLAERAPAYAECHATVNAAQPLESIVNDLIRVVNDTECHRVVVPLGLRTYPVMIGTGCRRRVGELASGAVRGRNALVISDQNTTKPWGEEVSELLREHSFHVAEVVIEPGEHHKSVRTVEQIWDAALDAGLDRQSMLVGVGGGVVGDLTAFAASTLLRGVAVAQVPTSLLAMVDSSVGGKTGFNRVHGKNLVGTFHQPHFVLCDQETLSTLAVAERTSGLAEVVKSAWIDGEDSVRELERDAAALAAGDSEALGRAIRMSVSLKASVVEADELESGRRMVLNLGHTLGHALEAVDGYQGIRHGEAVSLGMIAAARVAEAMHGLGEGQSERLMNLLAALGLPVDLRDHLTERAVSFIGSDKKRRGDDVMFIMPHAPGDVRVERHPTHQIAKSMLAILG